MGKLSTKENKTIYHLSREETGLSREKASLALGWISPERLEKIENEKSNPRPDEVLEMATVYKNPSLCNYYCANQCPIGLQYVPAIKIKDLSSIVLEMLSSLNKIQHKQERFIEIAADSHISSEEIADFIKIQEELEKLSINIETLQLWSENMLVNGTINIDEYNRIKNNK
ncbi:MAG: helix-turn-helix transcriptional regulator [Holdemanella sp.]|mgnify:CR=1 FL=1|nr:helix-turn-helix transcriptional regulator [Holdemanella sp.]